MFLGYEQTAFQFRNGPEKFAARIVDSNTVVSYGAETYYYTVGGSENVVNGSSYGHGITNQTANWVYHNPDQTNTVVAPNNTPTQRVPLLPTAGQPAKLFIKSGYQFWVNTCFIYYTTDGSNPEGAFGVGKGTTQIIQAHWAGADSQDGTIDWWTNTIPGQSDGTQVRYKVGLFKGGRVYNDQSIQPISDAEPQGSKYYGVNQAAITNFNPSTATVWLHNDLNPANTVSGLQSGFHILRARVFLPRSGRSSVFNTFAQTFYYAGPLPTGVIIFPTNNGTISSSTYNVVVRADSTVAGVDYNIQDSNPNNDDIVSGRTNGNGNDAQGAPIFVAAKSVNPNSGYSATYPNYPQEFQFVYTNVPSSGTATINIRLKDYSASVYTNRYTTLTATVNTLAPSQVVRIASPATDGTVIPYGTNVTYIIQACFTASLYQTGANDFNVLINSNLQPQSAYSLIPVGGNNAYCPGLRTLQYNWNNPAPGANTITVTYTNAIVPISDTRLVTVSSPLMISGLANNNQLVLWSSTPGLNYQVLATTNLAVPFTPISDVIPSQGLTTSFYDDNPAPQKFYRVMLVQ
jgi:hypothetical protein